MSDKPKKSGVGIWLWALAFLVMLGTSVFQRRTGPTYPLRGSVDVNGQQIKYSLPRSAVDSRDASVSIPDPDAPGLPARVLWRRHPSEDPFTVVMMEPRTENGSKALTANIPAHQAAAWVEYKIEIANTAIPADGKNETVLLRFRGSVSPYALFPHILLMFAAMLFSTRAGLGGLLGKDEKNLPWVTLSLVFLGGLLLGPVVQKAAFGAYWTGWPFGGDWTDNKTLIMFVGWLIACSSLLFGRIPKPARCAVVVLASLLTLVVYLIPHSRRGSRLDHQTGTVQTGL